MNIFPHGSAADPMHSLYAGISKIQLRNGKLTIFDESGAPIPISLPDNAPLAAPLAVLSAIPGSSVLNQLIIQDPSAQASSNGGTVIYVSETTSSGNTIGGYAISEGSQVQMAYISYSAGSDINGTATLAYQQFSNVWVLRESTLTSSLSDAYSTQTSQFFNITWSDNPTGNSRRAAKVTSASPAPTYDNSQAIQESPEVVVGPSGNSATIEVQNIGQGATNLLFQHGILSSARTWDRMDPWLRMDFPLASVLKSSLGSTDRLTNQANDLITLLDGTGKNQILAIGHSQGGLIVRDVAFRRGDLLNRVITLDTPNNGAWITQFERAALGGAMVALARSLIRWGNGTPLSGAVFTLGNALWISVPAMSVMAFDSAVPSTQDFRPGSSYLANLNSRSETFRNAGITSASRRRFVEYRVVGDRACSPEAPCGGRAFSNYANGVYFGLQTCRIIALLFNHGGWWRFCTLTALNLDLIDLFWYVFTSFGDSSDGVVQGSGQFYSNALFNHRIDNADSHVGATKSDKVRSMLDFTLQNDFFLTPRWCMTGSVWPSVISMLDLGGSQSFTVSAVSGCPWTAVSSVPWITIQSGASGSGSGTVAFTADINLSPEPRQGVITVTGLSANLSVTITQAGIPSAAAIGSVTIQGGTQGGDFEVSEWGCVLWYSDGGCAEEGWVTEWQWVWDSGQVWINVNGQAKYVWYGQGSSPRSIALDLAAAINNDAGFPVRAGVMGSTVWLVSKATQNANYSFYSWTHYDYAHFSEPSFTTTTSGPTLTGSP
jgi:pimeloyl-ACP methyl ester carboxylesterase